MIERRRARTRSQVDMGPPIVDAENPYKAVIKPRNPGESIKVAETVLKRRDRNLKANAQRAAAVAQVRRNQKDYKKGKLKIVRAEKLIKQSRLKKLDRERVLHSKNKKKPKKGGGRIVAAVRNGRGGGSRDVKAMLKKLGMNERHTLIWLPNTDETASMLNIIRPFAFWGMPTYKAVSTIMQKKALFKDPKNPKERTALSDNALVETHLGDLGLLCTEDLAHAIHTGAPCLKKVQERLWPVPLGDQKKANGMVHDKDFTCGDLKAFISDKLVQILGE